MEAHINPREIGGKSINILYISNQHPWPLNSGGRQRAYHLIKGLVQTHRLTLVVVTREPFNSNDLKSFPLFEKCQQVIVVEARPLNDPTISRFKPWAPISERIRSLFSSPFPNQVQSWLSPEIVTELNELRRSRSFDAVWVERPFIAELARRAGFKHLVVDVDNIESICLLRQLWCTPWYLSKAIHYVDFLKMWIYDFILPWRYQRLVVCKEDDRVFFRTRRSKVFVVPNGVEDYLEPSRATERANELLFVGSMNYEPNVDAVHYFINAIAPGLLSLAPEARLRVVGGGPLPDGWSFKHEIIAKVELDVPDVSPYFADAAVVVAPIRLGSGTRLKVLEALARGKAVVATPTAVEGLDLRPGVDIEIAATPGEFAAACARLLSDPGARNRIGDNGRKKVMKLYRWEKVSVIADQIISG